MSDIDSLSGHNYAIGIAYGTVIENARGSEHDDYLIGNVASNDILGGEGDDRIYGDGAGFARYRPLSSYVTLGHTTNDTEYWYYEQHNGANPRNTQLDELDGGEGDDVIIGGSGHNILRGGEGDDVMVARGHTTAMYGGEGADQFRLGANAWIRDSVNLDEGDTAYYCGIRIYGGTRQWWMEGGKAYWSPFSTLMAAFPVIGAELLATAAFFVDQVTMKLVTYMRDSEGSLLMNFGFGQGGAAAISDYLIDFDSGLASAAVSVFQIDPGNGGGSLTRIESFVNLALYAGFGIGLYGFDPLVLDLDGDGYELTTEQNSRAYFEFDTDGFAERTGWVRPDDGLLAFDINANGTIDGIAELFGNRDMSGFTMLAAYDLNSDGAIDASDAVYADLRVWRDLDQDGVSDSGELHTLADLGIVSISLASSAPAEPAAVGGNEIARTGTFTRSDGSTGGVADVAFTINETASRWLGDSTIGASAALLPQLKGFGTIKDLRVAMTGDAVLEGLVADFAVETTNDLATLKADAEAILYQWAGVAGTAADAIGANGFDARKLAFLERYSGYELMPRDGNGDPLLDNIEEVEALWADQVMRLTLRLVVQGPMSDEFDGISYRADLDLLVADTATALGNLYAGLLAGLPSDPGDALAEWEAWAPLLGAMADGMRRFDANLVRDDYVAAQLLAATDGIVQPLDFATLAGALGIENLSVGTGGNDTLARGAAEGLALYLGNGGTDTIEGGTGQDVYIFGETIGQVTIDDEEGKPAGDRIRFAFLTPDDVTLERDGNDLRITVDATGETVRVIGQFAPVVPMGSDLLLSSNKGIEEIQFADGAIFEIPEIASAVGTGSDGDDHMVGTMHTDVLLGGLGDDLLEGGDDADLYVVNAGEGHDVIRDVQTTPLLRAADMLVFGDGLLPEDLTFTRQGGGDDLLITIGAGGQSILIGDQFAYTSLGYNYFLAPNSRIEAFAFREVADNWGIRELQQQLVAGTTTAGDDVTLGFGDDDVFGASAGDDLMIGLDGQDRYQWGAGSGNDVIDEQSRYIDINVGLGGLSLIDAADTVQFISGVVLADIAFSRTSSNDLVVTIVSTGETLTIVDQFAGFQTGPLGAQWLDRIEWFEFSDGTRVSWQDVLADVTTGGDGDDSLYGDLYADRLVGGLGDDFLSGRGYGDTYVFGLGDGHDAIADDNASLLDEGFVTLDTNPDILELGPGIAETDIMFERDGDDVTLVIGAGVDRVTLEGQDDYFHTGVFGAVSLNRIEEIRFDGGAVWTWAQLNSRIIAAATGAGDDIVLGFMMADRFEASAGDDLLMGGDSGDIYAFGPGSGHDVIRESVSNVLYGDFDIVEFGATVLPGDVTLSRDDGDLIVTLAAGDTLSVEGQFDYQAFYTWTDVELFRFANEVEWTKADVQTMLLAASAGDDHLIGFSSDDLLDGGAGNDILEGKDGSDTYHFELGGGNDIIRESRANTNLGEHDRLVFGPGVLVSDVTFSRVEDDLVATIVSTGQTVTVEGHFSFSNWFAWNDVEQFDFADGTSLTDLEVAALIMGGTPGDDHLIGTFRSDTLDGGAGNDILEGGDGADRYVFGLGYGNDEIVESLSNANLSEDDQLEFLPGITLEDLGFARDGNDLVITIVGASDTLRVTDQFAYTNWYTWWDVDRFVFADGTILAKEDVQQIILTPTAGDDHQIGFMTGDTLDGGAGNDILEGGDGADTYVFGLGYGQDEIVEVMHNANLSENDTLRFGPGIDWEDLVFSRSGDTLTIGIAGTSDTLTIDNEWTTINDSSTQTWWDIENFVLDDGTAKTKTDVQIAVLQALSTAGNDTITGFYTADTLTGGLGDDLLNGGRGGDTFVHNVGDGHDTIADYVNYWGSAGDRLLLGAGITAADVVVTQSGTAAGDMILTILGGQSSVTLKNQATGGGEWTLDLVEFADGTIWTEADLAVRFVQSQPTAGADVIQGTNVADTVSAGDGDDVIHAIAGNDTLGGGAGADIIYAGSGNDNVTGDDGGDTLIGGSGNDILAGNASNDLMHGDGGNDTFHFAAGDGDDVIQEFSGDFGNGKGGTDVLIFAAGILTSQVAVSLANGGNDIVLTISGGTDRVTLRNTVNSSDNRVEEVRFADGTVWTHANLLAMATGGTPGNDSLYGDGNPNTLSGDAGDDLLDGRGGDDLLVGGTGNDLLIGAAGNDTYFFNLGDGQDIIREYVWPGGWGGTDTLEFGEGIAPEDILVSQGNWGQHLVFSIAGTTDQITVERTAVDGKFRLEQVLFADGTIWNHAEMMALATLPTAGNDTFYGSYDSDSLAGGEGDDILIARHGDDILAGNAGNDLMHGDTGNDTYRFGRGDGQDVVSEFSGNFDNGFGGTDIVELGPDIAPSDIVVTQGYFGNDLVLSIVGTSDVLTLQATTNNSRYRVEEVRFVDGTVWTHADLVARSILANSGNDIFYGSYDSETLSGGAGDDTLVGRGGHDILIGGTGNDLLHGESGDDVFRFGIGDGQDVVTEFSGDFSNGFGGNDAVEFAAGIAPSDILVAQGDGGNDIILTIAATGDRITLNNTVWDSRNRVEQVRFSDGTVWDHAALVTLSLAPKPTGDSYWGGTGADTLSGGDGDDSIYGADGNDTLSGDAGNDLLSGGNGNDILAGGDGNDLIYPDAGADSVDGGAGSDTVDVSSLSVAINVDLALASNQANLGTGGIETWNNVENVIAGSGADTLQGNDADNLLSGRNGVDNLSGRDGNDILIGGAGDDSLDGGAGDDVFQYVGGDGWDYLYGGDGYDTIAAAAANVAISLRPLTSIEAISGAGFANVTLSFGSGADTFNFSALTLTGIARIDGWGGADVLTGSAGGDTFAGGTGDDTLNGGAGDDVFLYGTNDGYDHVTGGDGFDTIAATANNAWIGLRSLASVEAISAGGFTNVTVWGSTAADTLDFSGVTLTGIVKIDAYGGNDVVTGSAAGDTIVGGTGDDTLNGGAGDDVFLYGTNDGYDHVTGGDGFDTIAATANNAWIGLRSLASVEAIGAGGFTNVTVWGSSVADTLDFSNVTLTGIVKIDGAGGNDVLTGSAGSDTIVGGAGNDWLSGRGGIDTLTGGSGADIFAFVPGSTGLDSSADRITDFAVGSDKIDLSAIDADMGTAGDQIFTFIGAAAFSGSAGELRYVKVGSDTWLQMDRDGDGFANLEIVLSGSPTPLGSDFFL